MKCVATFQLGEYFDILWFQDTNKLTFSSDEGTKPILEEKLAQHFDNHPELEEDDTYRKYYLFRKRSSPSKVTQSIGNEITSSPSYKVLKPLNDKLKSSPNKLLSISKGFKNKSSPYKSAQDEEDEDEEDDDEEEEEEEEDDDDIEILSRSSGKDGELLEDDEEHEDADYHPKFEFLTKIQDWFIGKYEDLYDYAEEQKDEFVYTAKKLNTDAKKKLSTTDAVNGLGQLLEVGLLINNQVPLISIKDAPFLSQEIISKYKFIDPTFKIWDISSLIQFKFILILLTWFGLSIGLPLLFSYYFNFIGKKQRKTKFDPLIFNVSKLLLAYLFIPKNVSFQDIKDDAAAWASEHGLIEHASILQIINAHLVHNTITLSLVLGNIPFIISGVGVLVALYVASI